MQVLSSIGVSGEPIAVAALGDVVLVSNRITQALEVYGNPGNSNRRMLLYTIGGGTRGPRTNRRGPLQSPGDLAVDTIRQQIFVIDRADSKVKVFGLQGNLILEFPPVDDQGRLLAPMAIAVDEARERILVSDYGDPRGSFRARVPARVLIYDYAGFYLRQIDGDGIVNGIRLRSLIFSRPVGLSVDHMGHLFLVDCLLSQVFVFDLNNWLDSNSVALVKKLGTLGNGPGQLSFPLDVVVDGSTGDVFVTNNDGGRVEVYRGG